MKTFLVLHGEVLRGFKHNVTAPNEKSICSRYLGKTLIKIEKFLKDSKWKPQLIITETGFG